MKQDDDTSQLETVENLQILINGAGLRCIKTDCSINLGSETHFTKCYFSKSLNITKASSRLIMTDCYVNNLTIETSDKFELILVDCNIDLLIISKNPNRQALNVIVKSESPKSSQIKVIKVHDYCTFDLASTTFGTISYFNDSTGFIGNTLNLVNCETLKDSEITVVNSTSHNLNVDNCNLGSVSFSRCNQSFFNLVDTKLSKELTILKSQNSQINTVRGEINQLVTKDSHNVILNSTETKFEEISTNKSQGQFSIKASINLDLLERELNYQPKINLIRTIDSNISLNTKGYLINLFFLRSNISQLLIEDSSILSSITIDQSYFNDSEFRNVSFRKDCKFILKHSDITKVKFNTVDWMRNHRLDESRKITIVDARAVITDHLSLKESYRQLKVISKEASNKFDELSFRAHEQRMQKEILYLRKEHLDWFLLWSNGVFSNYGLSYSRPLIFLFTFHFLFFSILIMGTNTFDYSFAFLTNSSIDSGLTIKAIGDYCSTLFPVHSFDYLKNQTGWPVIVDLIMRIMSGYFIFYFLSASRKFHNT